VTGNTQLSDPQAEMPVPIPQLNIFRRLPSEVPILLSIISFVFGICVKFGLAF
jgi:hypothetical protein